MSYRYALAGNPNCGKTTLFNAVTGSNQYVGNWPGVTVEKKEGKINIGDTDATIVDLPGIYSLSPYSMEEIVTRNYLIDEKPDLINSRCHKSRKKPLFKLTDCRAWLSNGNCTQHGGYAGKKKRNN